MVCADATGCCAGPYKRGAGGDDAPILVGFILLIGTAVSICLSRRSQQVLISPYVIGTTHLQSILLILTNLYNLI